VVRVVTAVLVSLVTALVALVTQPSSAQPRTARLPAARVACPTGQVLPGPVTPISPAGGSSNLVVDDTGRLTSAFPLEHGANPSVSDLRSADVPASPGDPRLIRSGSDPSYPAIAGPRALGIDAAGNQTFAWREGPFDARLGLSDVKVATRSPGGAWSAPVVVNRGPGLFDKLALAVNADGAAVLTWVRARPSGQRPDFDNDAVVAAYRPAAFASWQPASDLVSHAGPSEVGIDDAGIATVVYGSSEVVPPARAAIRVRRYEPTVGWGPARRISRDNDAFESFVVLAVSPNGAATLAWEQDQGRSSPSGHFTRRMNPAGQWLPVVRRRGGRQILSDALAMGGRGSAVAAWWNGRHDVVTQTSHRDGSWRRRMVLAKAQREAVTFRLEVRTNRRGDTLVVWQLSRDLARLWARYRPAGGAWAPAQRLTPPGVEQIAWTTAIGPDGTAAVAWSGVHGLEARQLTVC
jgi:hypothetical protein